MLISMCALHLEMCAYSEADARIHTPVQLLPLHHTVSWEIKPMFVALICLLHMYLRRSYTHSAAEDEILPTAAGRCLLQKGINELKMLLLLTMSS